MPLICTVNVRSLKRLQHSKPLEEKMPRVKSIRCEEPFYSKANGQKSEGVGARVGGRLKKAKIVFDPSINNVSKKITRSLSVCLEQYNVTTKHSKSNSLSDNNSKKSVTFLTSPPVLELQVNDCMICGKVDVRKSKKIIACKDCNYRVHSSCLKINYLNHDLLEEHWRCDNCRTCVVCYETSETGPLVSCYVCVSAYHIGCHTPKLQLNKNLNKCKWECTKCQNINKNALNKQISSTDYTKRRSSMPSEIRRDEKLEKRDSETPSISKTHTTDNIPDISDWSSEKVSKYMEKFFPKEAHVFREHEIDGATLLLMKRSDIICGLALKLGPAIRIYSFIVQLQSKSNDPRLTWM